MENKAKMTLNTVNDFLGNGEYHGFLESVSNAFDKITSVHKNLFMTDIQNIYDIYLDNLPEAARQHYNCNACRHFINRFGNLVVINEDGTHESAIWTEDVNPFFKESFEALRRAIRRSKIVSPFYSAESVLGTPVTGEWRHLSVNIPDDMLIKREEFCLYKEPHQLMAERIEDFGMLKRAIEKYNKQTVDTAIAILDADILYRAEKILGVAKWLKMIHVELDKTKDERRRDGILWLATVAAPTGFCHVNSSMIGTLLDDINDNLEIEDIKDRFGYKMDPTRYQRRTAAPKNANIERAEQIFKEMGLEKSLDRRFARVEELKTLWQPSQEVIEESKKEVGLFAHLKQQKEEVRVSDFTSNVKVITWEKFQRTVLPLAKKIEYLVKGFRAPYAGILTQLHDDARPIIQWDKEDARNPFSHYVYNELPSHGAWNVSGPKAEVTAICYQPSMWQEGFDHHGKAVMFIIKGCKDTRYTDNNASHNALFTEIIKSELREVASTITAFAESSTIHGYDEASACGIRLQEKLEHDCIFDVTTETGVLRYKIDRWD